MPCRYMFAVLETRAIQLSFSFQFDDAILLKATIRKFRATVVVDVLPLLPASLSPRRYDVEAPNTE